MIIVYFLGYPLLQLIKSVINVIDTDEDRTILTNLQLKDILKSEFSIDIHNKTELETDIYLNVLKHFLKTWPSWDEVDSLVKLGRSDPQKITEEMYQKFYVNLKQYLFQNLVMTNDIMKPYMEKFTKKCEMMKNSSKKGEEPQEGQEIEMEIFCTQEQFNNLIYRQPHPETGTIFNVNNIPSPSKISIRQFTFAQIMNWPNVQVWLSLPGVDCMRVNTSKIVRTLMNMKRPENNELKNSIHPLDKDSIYYRQQISKTEMNKACLMKYFQQMYKLCSVFEDLIDQIVFKKIVEEFENDCNNGPEVIKHGEYRLTLHDYKYVRYLYTKSNVSHTSRKMELEGINCEDYDLQIQEMLTPLHVFQIKMDVDESWDDNFIKNKVLRALCNKPSWGRLKCIMCDVSFMLMGSLGEVLSHFNEFHQTELDWQCTGCKKSFPMATLADCRWTHTCVSSSK